MSETLVAIASYRPHPGQEQALRDLVKNHLPTLRQEGLVTDRDAYLFQAEDGTLLEVFEWKSEAAKDAAHKSESVMKIWARMMEVAEMTSLSTLAEAARPFPNFKTVSL